MQCQLSQLSFYYEDFGEGRPLVAMHGFGKTLTPPIKSKLPRYVRTLSEVPSRENNRIAQKYRGHFRWSP